MSKVEGEVDNNEVWKEVNILLILEGCVCGAPMLSWIKGIEMGEMYWIEMVGPFHFCLLSEAEKLLAR